jgi:copper oxidase (laccase) domain-containing protein
LRELKETIHGCIHSIWRGAFAVVVAKLVFKQIKLACMEDSALVIKDSDRVGA